MWGNGVVPAVHLVHEVRVAAACDAVFAVAADPRTWARWHPSTVSVAGCERVMAAGDRFTERVQAAGVVGDIAWHVAACRPPRDYSVEGMVDFPLMRRTPVTITYHFEPDGNGTHVRRDLVYSPSNRIARLADRLFFRRHNHRQSREALARLTRLILSETAPPAAPNDPPAR